MLDELIFHPELVVETEKQSFTSIQPITYSGVIQGELFCCVLFLLVCFLFSDCSVLVFPFIHSFVGSFVRSFIRSFVHSFNRSFIRSFAHLFNSSFVHPFVRSFIHVFIHTTVIAVSLFDSLLLLTGRDLSWTEYLHKCHYATKL